MRRLRVWLHRFEDALIVTVLLGMVLLAVAHYDWWLWNDGGLVLGLPAGLTFHLLFTAATAIAMWMLVRNAWPDRLDAEANADREPDAEELDR